VGGRMKHGERPVRWSQWHILGDKPVSVTLTTAPTCRFDSQNLHWNMLIDIKDVATLWRSSAEAFCQLLERKTAHG
jgi:hypothetical protein